MPNVSLASKPAYWLFKCGLSSLFLGFLALFWISLLRSDTSNLSGGIAFGYLLTVGVGLYLYLVRRFLNTLDYAVEIVPGRLKVTSAKGLQSEIPLHPSMKIRVVRKPKLCHCIIEHEGEAMASFLPTADLLQSLLHSSPQLYWQGLMRRYLHT